MRKVGLVVNPIAGIGGPSGLKGSDRLEKVMKAISLGYRKVSPKRTELFLKELLSILDPNQMKEIEFLTYSGEMGEIELRKFGIDPVVFGEEKEVTTREDTMEAVRHFIENGVEIILFCGGDGTARDVFQSLSGKETPVIGIPGGVKMYSGVFASNPRDAAELLYYFLLGETTLVDEEVIDVDEENLEENPNFRVIGYLKVPKYRKETLLQGKKEPTPMEEDSIKEEIAERIIEEMSPDTVYVIGPGSTTLKLKEKIGEYTKFGVDVYLNGKCISKDVDELKLLSLIEENKDKEIKLILTVVGGQNFLLGRGNQQISPRVLDKIGVDNMIVIATPSKLRKGYVKVDQEYKDFFDGKKYVRVVSSYFEEVLIKIDP